MLLKTNPSLTNLSLADKDTGLELFSISQDFASKTLTAVAGPFSKTIEHPSYTRSISASSNARKVSANAVATLNPGSATYDLDGFRASGRRIGSGYQITAPTKTYSFTDAQFNGLFTGNRVYASAATAGVSATSRSTRSGGVQVDGGGDGSSYPACDFAYSVVPCVSSDGSLVIGYDPGTYGAGGSFWGGAGSDVSTTNPYGSVTVGTPGISQAYLNCIISNLTGELTSVITLIGAVVAQLIQNTGGYLNFARFAATPLPILIELVGTAIATLGGANLLFAIGGAVGIVGFAWALITCVQ